MKIEHDLIAITEKISLACGATKNKITYFVVASVVASLYLAWLIFAPQGALWWNASKVIIVLLPVTLWLFFWFMLSQLQALPEHVKSLSLSNQTDPQNLLGNLQQTAKSNSGVLRIVKLLWQLRAHEGVAGLMETVGGLGLLFNPVFLILIIVTGLALLAFIVLASLLIIF